MSSKPKPTGWDWILLAVLIVLLVGGIGLRSRASGDEGGLGWSLPDIILNIIVPDSGDGDGDDWTPPDWSPPEAPDNWREPTSLFVDVSPNPMTMGGWLIGTVVSNGYNHEITVTVRHKGSGEGIIINAWVGTDGKFEHAQQMNTPGYWEFTVEGGSAAPVTAELTVEGILIVPESEHYSKTFRDSLQLEVYTHLRNSNAAIVGHYPSGSYSRPITNTAINAGGYGTVAPGLDHLANGSWELDVVIYSETADDYDGTAWITIGR